MKIQGNKHISLSETAFKITYTLTNQLIIISTEEQ